VDFIESDDGVPIGFELIGAGLDAGDPVLVLPGGPCRDPSYVGDLAGAAGSRRLAILHVRGTPATGGLSRGWWADAADAVAVADRLGIDAADVVAHSAGTRLALAMAVRFPERVRSLALVTPAAAWLTGVPHDGVEVASRRAEPEVAAALASAEREPIDEEAFRRAVEVESSLGYARWGTEQRRHAARGAMTLAAARSWFRGYRPMPPTASCGRPGRRRSSWVVTRTSSAGSRPCARSPRRSGPGWCSSRTAATTPGSSSPGRSGAR